MVLEAGIEFICGLTNSMLNAIQATVTKIVNAFQAFVAWAIEFINSVITSIFSPIADTISHSIDSFCCNLEGVCAGIESDIESTGDYDVSAIVTLYAVIAGELFIAIVGLATLVMLTFTILAAITSVASFLLLCVVDLIVSFIVSATIGALFEYYSGNDPDPSHALDEQLRSMIIGNGGNLDENTVANLEFDVALGALGLLATNLYNKCPSLPESIGSKIPKAIALGVLGIIITTWSASSGHELFLFIGAGMSLYGLVLSIADLTAIGGTGIYTKMVVVLSTLINGIAFIKSGAMLWEEYHT